MFFSAEWSDESKLMENVVNELVKDDKYRNSARFLQIEAENFEDLAIRYNVEAVPTFVFLRERVIRLHTLTGVNAAELRSKLDQFVQTPTSTSTTSADTNGNLDARLKSLINTAPITLFMKGNPSEPKCKFSRETIEILKSQNVKDFGYFDILSDQEVRDGLKKYSNWPTYPQLYFNGELIGGLDIIKELVQSSEFQKMLPKPEESLNEKLKKLINKSKVMLFMKGNPSEPKCGFSRTITGILNQTGVEYDSFDILTDETVRQGLKEYSNWPTYPQLYVNGELIGGLDIVKELEQSGELLSTLRGA